LSKPGNSAFSDDGYCALLRALRERGYQFASFADVDTAAPHAVLRHDIDMSIEAAVRMAEIEAGLGVRSHYFVLLRTEIYNALSRNGLAGLQEIVALGHDVGLHFDASLYAPDRAALDAAAATEVGMLEGALGRRIGMISLHRPAPSLIGDTLPLAGRPHSYQPRFIGDIGYCSDSRGEWGHGHPLDHPAVCEGRALQLLTHPIWWIGSGATAQEKVMRILDGRFALMEKAMAENCDIYRPRMLESRK
jgi:hypothetical protein